MANSVTATTYPSNRADASETKLEEWISPHVPDGVIWDEGNGLALFADSTGMQVKLPSGSVSLAAIRGDLASQTTLDIAAANATNPRIDTVIAELKRTPSPYTITFKVVSGAAAASPVPPTLTNDATYRRLAIGDVRVEAGATTIAANKVSLRRIFTGRTEWRSWTPVLSAEAGGAYLVATDYISLAGASGRYYFDDMICHFRWSTLLTFTGTSSSVGLLATLPIANRDPETVFTADVQNDTGRAITNSAIQMRIYPAAPWVTDGIGRWVRISGSYEIAAQ